MLNDCFILCSEVILTIMTEQLASAEENLDRILAVQSCFGPKGMPLNEPGRVLVGEGHLVKLCRRRHQPRVFFLFNDILVYGSILVHGRWYTSQQVIQLKNIEVENLEDSPDMKNQFLIPRTPQVLLCVGTLAPGEVCWITHIKECCDKLEGTVQEPGQGLAHSWVPDSASSNCMRCDRKFTTMHRRHPLQEMWSLQAEKTTRNRGDSGGNSWSDESSSDEDGTELRKYPSSQQWVEQSNHVVQGWSSYSAK
ncbi:hypothetical protein SKAU_G00309920 [Synaphobranchus kaupii]|uniref:Uncharacterized protein n=1 Tax=Synaphobranchus kaupii TaxID=118154 RepID=A0A9Q1IKY4_SYNKA|nr:hypothetical protein SKAU_G00309920 [Synaphobranchus kaupii]